MAVSTVRLVEWMLDANSLAFVVTVFKPWRVFRLSVGFTLLEIVMLDLDLWFLSFNLQIGSGRWFYIDDDEE